MGAAVPGIPPRRTLARLAAALVGATLAASACAPQSAPSGVPVKEGGELLTSVVDNLNDAGRGASVTLDPDGNPVVSYILATPMPVPGVLPAPVVAGQPQPPAVMVATHTEGIWQKTSVTEQGGLGQDAVGVAPELVDRHGFALPDVTTSLAIDEQGERHVIWSTPSGLFYASAADPGSGFSEKERIVAGEVRGGSIAVDSAGTPWVSAYTEDGLLLFHTEGGEWTSEEIPVARLIGLPDTVEEPPGQVTAIRLRTDGEPVVAYENGGRAKVATREEGTWTTIGAPVGGIGISLALDGDDNPHLAAYDGSGNVKHAHFVGGAWTVTDLGSTESSAEEGGPDPAWSTGIALTDEGVHYVTWANTSDGLIELATNAEGEFEVQEAPSGQGGANPAVAVSGDGTTLAVAWFDTKNQNLEVATNGGELPLAFSPQPTAAPSPQESPAAADCKPEGTALSIAAENIAFDKDCLAAPADTAFTLEFQNNDPPGLLHNIAIYTDQAAGEEILKPDLIDGGTSETYDLEPLEAGEYFFRCDAHPLQMTGTFVVAAEG